MNKKALEYIGIAAFALPLLFYLSGLLYETIFFRILGVSFLRLYSIADIARSSLTVLFPNAPLFLVFSIFFAGSLYGIYRGNIKPHLAVLIVAGLIAWISILLVVLMPHVSNIPTKTKLWVVPMAGFTAVVACSMLLAALNYKRDFIFFLGAAVIVWFIFMGTLAAKEGQAVRENFSKSVRFIQTNFDHDWPEGETLDPIRVLSDGFIAVSSAGRIIYIPRERVEFISQQMSNP